MQLLWRRGSLCLLLAVCKLVLFYWINSLNILYGHFVGSHTHCITSNPQFRLFLYKNCIKFKRLCQCQLFSILTVEIKAVFLICILPLSSQLVIQSFWAAALSSSAVIWSVCGLMSNRQMCLWCLFSLITPHFNECEKLSKCVLINSQHGPLYFTHY